MVFHRRCREMNVGTPRTGREELGQSAFLWRRVFYVFGLARIIKWIFDLFDVKAILLKFHAKQRC